MDYHFRKATLAELPQIWTILRHAIERRKADGSNQWQDGYPNPDVVRADLEKGVGFVLTEADTIVGYTAVLVNDEPEYAHIDGQWRTDGDFVVFHRVAIAQTHLGKGLANRLLACIEAYALRHHVYSLKADTNFDNVAMIRTFEKAGYVYCGEVYFRGSPRKAFEKVLPKVA